VKKFLSCDEINRSAHHRSADAFPGPVEDRGNLGYALTSNHERTVSAGNDR
jgi:hypothetical protein